MSSIREGARSGEGPPLHPAARRARLAVRCPVGVLSAFGLVAVVLAIVLAVVGGGFGPKAPVALAAIRSDAPVLMAHRGLAREHPENTRAAFEAARRAGFAGVEIDVKRSADGRFYLFHDRESTRLLGVEVDLDRLTLAELQRFPVRWNGRETGQRILSLSAFADEFAEDFVVYLHVKRHGDDRYRALADEIARFVDGRGLGRRVVIGGDFLFIASLEFRHPTLLTSVGGPGDFKARVYRLIPRRFRPDLIVSRFDEITPGHLRWLESSGLAERWIVGDVDPEDLERARRWNVSMLIVNR